MNHSLTVILTRVILVVGIAGCALAAEELPKVVVDQLEAVTPAIAKAYADFSKKVNDENGKLIIAIQKAMEKATKAGKLDDALALRAALEKAKNGDFIKAYLSPNVDDLLGARAGNPPVDAIATVTTSTEDPVETLAPNMPTYDNRDYLFSDVPKELMGLAYLQRPFKEPAPCTVKVVKAGMLYVAVGVPNDGKEFETQGFAKTDLKLSTATGQLLIVKKIVRAGETITLSPNATTNSFPIWKAK